MCGEGNVFASFCFHLAATTFILVDMLNAYVKVTYSQHIQMGHCKV